MTDAESRPKSPRYAVWGVPVVFVAALVLRAAPLSGPEAADAAESPPATPFDALPTACPPEVAPLATARADEERARIMMARHPFDQRDGVRAESLLVRAGHCYRAAGSARDADRLQADAATWRVDLEHEYRSHLLRMRLALEQERHAEALSAVRTLRRFLADTDHEFASVLKVREQRLAGEVTKQEEEE